MKQAKTNYFVAKCGKKVKKEGKAADNKLVLGIVIAGVIIACGNYNRNNSSDQNKMVIALEEKLNRQVLMDKQYLKHLN